MLIWSLDCQMFSHAVMRTHKIPIEWPISVKISRPLSSIHHICHFSPQTKFLAPFFFTQNSNKTDFATNQCNSQKKNFVKKSSIKCNKTPKGKPQTFVIWKNFRFLHTILPHLTWSTGRDIMIIIKQDLFPMNIMPSCAPQL